MRVSTEATEKTRALQKAWREAHPDYAKAYYADNREKIAAQERARKKANPEKVAAARKAYRQAHRKQENEARTARRKKLAAIKRAEREDAREKALAEKIAAKAAKRAAAKERATAYRKAYRKAHPEQRRAIESAYRKRNPERTAAKSSNNEARRRKAQGKHTAAEVKAMFERQGRRCLCGVKLTPKNRHLDHIEPLARGGHNSIGNLQWLCAPCNIRKGAKCPVEWAQENGRLI